MFEICSLKQIRALTSPVRQAIVDALEATGPSSALELSSVLGTRSDRLYYHLQILKKAGLVQSHRERSRIGRLQERFDLPGRPTRIHYDPADPRNASAIVAMIGSTFRDAHRAFGKAYVKGAVVRGRARTVRAGRRAGWLGPKELREVNALIERMGRIMGHPRGGRRMRHFAFTFAFSPYGNLLQQASERRRSTGRPGRSQR